MGRAGLPERSRQRRGCAPRGLSSRPAREARGYAEATDFSCQAEDAPAGYTSDGRVTVVADAPGSYTFVARVTELSATDAHPAKAGVRCQECGREDDSAAEAMIGLRLRHRRIVDPRTVGIPRSP